MTRPTLQRIWWALLTLALVPLFAALGILACVLAVLPITPSRNARRNLHERLGCSPGLAWAHTAGLYVHYGLYLLEVVLYWPLRAVIEDNRSSYFAFLDDVDQAYALKAAGKGMLFLGGHFGVIEQIGGTTNEWLVSRGHARLAVLAKPGRNRALTALMDAYRHLRGFDVIWTTSRLGSLAQRMGAACASGASLGMIVDQKPRTGGVFVPFFGAPAAFPARGIDFGVGQGLPCLATTARRRAPGWFHIEYALLPQDGVPRTETHKASQQAQTASSPLSSGGPEPTLKVANPDALDRARRSASISYAPPAKARPVAMPGQPQPPQHQTLMVLSHFAAWLETVIRMSPSQWSWEYRKWSRSGGPKPEPEHEPGDGPK